MYTDKLVPSSMEKPSAPLREFADLVRWHNIWVRATVAVSVLLVVCGAVLGTLLGLTWSSRDSAIRFHDECDGYRASLERVPYELFGDDNVIVVPGGDTDNRNMLAVHGAKVDPSTCEGRLHAALTARGAVHGAPSTETRGRALQPNDYRTALKAPFKSRDFSFPWKCYGHENPRVGGVYESDPTMWTISHSQPTSCAVCRTVEDDNWAKNMGRITPGQQGSLWDSCGKSGESTSDMLYVEVTKDRVAQRLRADHDPENGRACTFVSQTDLSMAWFVVGTVRATPFKKITPHFNEDAPASVIGNPCSSRQQYIGWLESCDVQACPEPVKFTCKSPEGSFSMDLYDICRNARVPLPNKPSCPSH